MCDAIRQWTRTAHSITTSPVRAYFRPCPLSEAKYRDLISMVNDGTIEGSYSKEQGCGVGVGVGVRSPGVLTFARSRSRSRSPIYKGDSGLRRKKKYMYVNWYFQTFEIIKLGSKDKIL